MKNFEKPEIMLELFDVEDIITDSTVITKPDPVEAVNNTELPEIEIDNGVVL